MMGNPSEGDYKAMVSQNLIPNCPVTCSDIANAKAMENGATDACACGCGLCGHSARTCASQQNGDAGCGRFFVDGTAFLLTVAWRINFVMGEYLPTRKAVSLSRHVRRVLDVYKRAGFRVRTILMDGEFEKLKLLMPQVECNTTAAKEHVSEAEQTIRMLKEQVRGLLVMLPFTHIPRRMKIEFIYFMILWMNSFPVKFGILQTYSPRELLV